MLKWKDNIKGPFMYTKLGWALEYIHVGFQLGYGDGFKHGLELLRDTYKPKPLQPNHTYFTDEELMDEDYIMERLANELLEKMK